MPQRTCLVCRGKFDSSQLVRLRHGLISGALELNPKSGSGRSAYCCSGSTCKQKFLDANRLQRAFKRAVSPDVFDRLAALMPTQK